MSITITPSLPSLPREPKSPRTCCAPFSLFTLIIHSFYSFRAVRSCRHEFSTCHCIWVCHLSYLFEVLLTCMCSRFLPRETLVEYIKSLETTIRDNNLPLPPLPPVKEARESPNIAESDKLYASPFVWAQLTLYVFVMYASFDRFQCCNYADYLKSSSELYYKW